VSSVSTGLSTLDRLDRLASGDAYIHRVDPRAKVLATAVFIVCVVSFGRYEVLALLPFVLFPIVMAVEGDVPLGLLARILLVVSPFALLVGAFNPWFDRETVAHIGGFGISGGWVSYASILLRFVLTASAALVLTATTSFNGVCLALQRLRVPGVFVTQLLLLYRYIFVLGDEAVRMDRARRLRSQGRRGMGVTIYSQMLGQLLLRTVARAQRIYLAMKCRGFDGQIRMSRRLRFGPGDLAFVLAWSGAFVLFRLVNIPLLLGGFIMDLLA
jgi:cobalt/nickel transport system permease protein